MSTPGIKLLSDVVQATIDGQAADAATGTSSPPAAGHRPPDEIPLSVRLDFAVLLTEAERAALRRPDTAFGRLPELPPTLYAVWRIRIDLHETFDLATVRGYAGLWVWAVADGRREVEALGPAISEARSALIEPTRTSGGDMMPVSCPWIAVLLWCCREDLQAGYPLTDAQSTASYLAWFLRHGVFELRCGDLLPDDHVRLLSSTGPGSPSLPLTRYVEFAHASRADLRDSFDLAGFEGRRALLKWFFETGVREYPTHPDILAHQSRALFEWGEQAIEPAATARS